ncbi:hypothetical protein F2Q69_00040976 [Brassica cretica]|uniref:Uncharacterized protein n=1 Tax=Brassica cretica TaxID=69181 RepID=A0A8S9N930_BRACR|nr:hypothetical protein F2Q69_00040976 [Brassica cretica]
MVHDPPVTREPREIINHPSHLLCVYLSSTKSMSTPMSSPSFFAFQASPTGAIAPRLGEGVRKSVFWKEFYGIDVIACDPSYLPWSMNRESPESLVNYQPSISPSLRLPFIYQEHVDTHEFTFFLRIPSHRSNRTSTGLGQRSAFNSVRSRSLWP